MNTLLFIHPLVIPPCRKTFWRIVTKILQQNGIHSGQVSKKKKKGNDKFLFSQELTK